MPIDLEFAHDLQDVIAWLEVGRERLLFLARLDVLGRARARRKEETEQENQREPGVGKSTIDVGSFPGNLHTLYKWRDCWRAGLSLTGR